MLITMLITDFEQLAFVAFRTTLRNILNWTTGHSQASEQPQPLDYISFNYLNVFLKSFCLIAYSSRPR